PASTAPARDLAAADPSNVLQDMPISTAERVVRRICLRVAAGPDAGRVFTCDLDAAGPPLRGGRSELCDVVLRDPRVSDLHFELLPPRGALLVRDLDSATGLLIGALRVREAWLSPGTGFCIGGTRLELVDLEFAEIPLLPFGHFGELDG